MKVGGIGQATECGEASRKPLKWASPFFLIADN